MQTKYKYKSIPPPSPEKKKENRLSKHFYSYYSCVTIHSPEEVISTKTSNPKMATTSSSNAVKMQGRQTRSSSKAVKPLKTAQLATPPPEAGTSTTDTHRAPRGDTDNEAPADKVKKTPKQRKKDSKQPTSCLSNIR